MFQESLPILLVLCQLGIWLLPCLFGCNSGEDDIDLIFFCESSLKLYQFNVFNWMLNCLFSVIPLIPNLHRHVVFKSRSSTSWDFYSFGSVEILVVCKWSQNMCRVTTSQEIEVRTWFSKILFISFDLITKSKKKKTWVVDTENWWSSLSWWNSLICNSEEGR